MGSAPMVSALARFFALERRLFERLSTRVVPFELGTAFLDEEFRLRYSSTFLLVEEPLDDVPAEAILQEADRILGGAGFAHRNVVVRDDRHGNRLASAFAENGYAVERDAIMVHRREADRGPDLAAEELSFTEMGPLLLETYRREPGVTSEDVARALADQHGKSERVIGTRFFAVELEGTLAGGCELYVDGPDAQVEHVGTLEEFRGRGVARTVVLRAVEVAREEGALHVYIGADEADWPGDLYGRLGFDRVGHTWEFLRWPADPPDLGTV